VGGQLQGEQAKAGDNGGRDGSCEHAAFPLIVGQASCLPAVNLGKQGCLPYGKIVAAAAIFREAVAADFTVC
jgi:hypothetical protein